MTATPDAPSVAALAVAEVRSATAHARFSSTLTLLQARLDPRTLASKAARDVSDAGNTAIETARERPAAAAGLATLAVLILARRPLTRLFRRIRGDRSAPTAGLNPVTRTRP